MKIFKRGQTWAFRKTHEGKQVWVSLRTTNKQDAKTKMAQFLVTLKNNGWEAAIAELKGKRVLKKGDSPTIEDMERLYREFMGQSVNPVSESTIHHNIGCLRRLMNLCKAPDIGNFDASKLKWTPANTSNQSAQIRAAQSIFKKSALIYWAKQGIHLKNPFAMIERRNIKKGGYIPLGQECRERIWNDSKDLPARQRMVVILALGAGLRRGEIQAARVSWLIKERNQTVLTVKAETGFKPKSGVHRSIQIPQELAAELEELRKNCILDPADPFLVPSGEKIGKVRHGCVFKALLPWLAERGLTEVKGIHGLRREAGSVVATAHGMLQAQKFLGHASIVTTESYYAGLTKSETIDMAGLIFGNPGDPFEEVAKQLGISVDELRALKLA
jgi:integrase